MKHHHKSVHMPTYHCYPKWRTGFDARMQNKFAVCCKPRGPQQSCSPRVENFHMGDAAHAAHAAKDKMLHILAPAWCGFSRKTAETEDMLKQMVGRLGVGVNMLTDETSEEFQRLMKDLDVRGFPHAVLVIGGDIVDQIKGHHPPHELARKVAEKAM
jgi:hypothetical protein